MRPPDAESADCASVEGAEAAVELHSVSVHVKAPDNVPGGRALLGGLIGGDIAAWQDGGSVETVGQEDSFGSNGSFEWLRRERMVLLCDLNSLKAKFELTLQALRAIFGLGASATWADLLERGEELAELVRGSGGGSLGGGTRVYCRRHSAKWARFEPVGHDQLPPVPAPAATDDGAEAEATADCGAWPPISLAEVEREQLEEKCEAQSAHILRLRELLQKQQRLLDMTASQIAEESQKSQTQAAMEAAMVAQEARVAEYCVQVENLRSEAARQSELVVDLEEKLRTQAERLAKLEADLAARASECRRSRSEVDRQRARVKELSDLLEEKGEYVDRMRDQLQVHEAAERRHYSYRMPPEFRRSCGAVNANAGIAVAAGEELSTPRDPGLPSARSRRREAAAAASADDGTSSTASSRSRLPQAPTRPMDDEERHAFLSHFPMAMRTERHLRTRMEAERTKHQSSTPAAASVSTSSFTPAVSSTPPKSVPAVGSPPAAASTPAAPSTPADPYTPRGCSLSTSAGCSLSTLAGGSTSVALGCSTSAPAGATPPAAVTPPSGCSTSAVAAATP